MLIARAPVRISLAGGGTDLPAYYERHGGFVVSTTIDKHFYVFLNVVDGNGLQINSSDYRAFYRYNGDAPPLWDDDLGLPRAILDHFGVTQGLSMFLASEIPPGTGLGSSSTVTVAIIKALAAAQGLPLARQELAELACHIEIEKLVQPIGKQDQYAAAFGGLNAITFMADGVTVEPLWLPAETLEQLQRNLLLFFTGSSRNASRILSQQKRASEERDPRVVEALHAVRMMAEEVRQCLQRGELERFGELLDRNWQRKKEFAPGVTTDYIDRCYQVARANGAIGGKITGAGGGGFFMVYCEEDARERVTHSLEAEGLRRMDYCFENNGAQVLMNASPRLSIAKDWQLSVCSSEEIWRV
jgi:D-glycero-alpha-D-manno-heptose-7-phosphate kinase